MYFRIWAGMGNLFFLIRHSLTAAKTIISSISDGIIVSSANFKGSWASTATDNEYTRFDITIYGIWRSVYRVEPICMIR